jgi:hypothetical protein
VHSSRFKLFSLLSEPEGAKFLEKLFQILIMNTKQQLAAAICEFLDQSIKDKTISSDDQEGIEVAIQCIQEAFKVTDVGSNSGLLKVYEVYLKTKVRYFNVAAKGTRSCTTIRTFCR